MKRYFIFNLLFPILFAFCKVAIAGDTIYAEPKPAFVQFASGFSNISDIANAGDSRLFVVEQSGNIKILNADGTTNTKSFIKVPNVLSGNEQGLLGLAFHPNYASNKQFFVNYIRGSGNGNTQISRFTTSNYPDTAILGSKFDILTFPQPYANHNGGDLNFGPDGYLYIGTGDGGLANDPLENGQKKNSLLGKLLRLEIDSGSPYSIPSSNPFVGNADYLPEIWALGLRNPWRISFDRLNSDLYIADVGQNKWEEVNYVPSGSAGGMNFGWDCWEGNHSFETAGCGPSSDFQFPVFEYAHNPECSITGGFVYRGNNYPRLYGKYICSDYCSGASYLLTKNDNAIFESSKYAQAISITTYGENNQGELFAGSGDGKVYKVIDTCTNFYATKSIQQACSGSGGSIVLNIFGGNGNKNIVWSNGNTTTNNNNLISGVYRLTITDGQGCKITDSTTIISNTPIAPIIAFNMETNTIECTSDAVSFEWFKDGLAYQINGNPVTTQNTIATTSGTYSVNSIDANGCESTSNDLLVTISGILNQDTKIGALSIYPNPSEGQFHISFNGKNTTANGIQVFDLLGKMIEQIELKTIGNQFETEINLSAFATGTYLVRVNTTSGVISKRIFKK